jgi:hypothetical protein
MRLEARLWPIWTGDHEVLTWMRKRIAEGQEPEAVAAE